MSRGILAMEKKIKAQRTEFAELKEKYEKVSELYAGKIVVCSEQRTEIQMLREVNARLRKGWCVKEE